MKFKTMGQVCSFCKGKCCQPPIYLGQVDFDKLKKAGKEFKTERTGEAGYNLVSSGKCPFLKPGVGCTLPEDLKPIDCILFPLAYVETEKGFEFYLNGLCPHTDKLPKDWIEKTKTWAEKRLLEWTPAERRTYALRQKNRLIKIS